MAQRRDFASLMESTAPARDRARRKLQAGEVVEGTVLQVGTEWIFVDVGTPGDGRIQSVELFDGTGSRVRVGDSVRATVVDAEPDGPTLTTTFGRGGDVDSSALHLALESGTPVEGVVARALKGGLEVNVGRVQAFCPASLVELGYVAELEGYVGQTLQFLVIELPKGRSPVLSRKALLAAAQKARERTLRAELEPGKEVSGVVSALHSMGATVDIGGLEGFIPISELAVSRVERVEDIVQIGEKVSVRILSIEDHPKGLRIRLSLRAAPEKREAPPRDEVLTGTVVATAQHGIIVATPKGEGFVPVRELVLAPGEDHRRAFPVGRTLDVVAIHHDAKSGRARFSVQAVRDVEERKNVRDYSAVAADPARSSSQVGSFGKLLKEKFGALAPDLQAHGVGPSSTLSAVEPPPHSHVAPPSPVVAPTLATPPFTAQGVPDSKLAAKPSNPGGTKPNDPWGVVRRRPR